VDNRGKASLTASEALRCPQEDRVVHSAACEFCYSSGGMAADVLFSGVADAQVSSDLREYLAGYGCNGALTAAVVAAGDALRNYAADATVRRGAEGPVGLFLAALPVWLMGGSGWIGGLGHRVQRGDQGTHPHRTRIRSEPGEPSSEPGKGRFACWRVFVTRHWEPD
jgi:hypothetical protein